MWNIKKLPEFLALIAALITVLVAVVNGKSFYIMAYQVSAVIIISYLLGSVLRSVMISTAKEILKRKQSAAISDNKRTKNEMHEDLGK